VDDPLAVMGYSGVVGDHHQCDVLLLVKAAKDIHYFLAGMAVKVPGRLVSQDDGRVLGQGAGHGHSLLFAARELVGTVVHTIAQSYHSQGFFSYPGITLAGIFLSQLDIPQGCKIGQQVKALEDKTDLLPPDPGKLTTALAAYLFSTQYVIPGSGPVQKTDHVQ
jgi:hypothetical protein